MAHFPLGDCRRSAAEPLKEHSSRLSKERMWHLRRQLREWFEDKATFLHPRMRNGEGRRLDHPIIVEEEIEVDRARRPALC